MFLKVTQHIALFPGSTFNFILNGPNKMCSVCYFHLQLGQKLTTVTNKPCCEQHRSSGILTRSYNKEADQLLGCCAANFRLTFCIPIPVCKKEGFLTTWSKPVTEFCNKPWLIRLLYRYLSHFSSLHEHSHAI